MKRSNLRSMVIAVVFICFGGSFHATKAAEPTCYGEGERDLAQDLFQDFMYPVLASAIDSAPNVQVDILEPACDPNETAAEKEAVNGLLKRDWHLLYTKAMRRHLNPGKVFVALDDLKRKADAKAAAAYRTRSDAAN